MAARSPAFDCPPLNENNYDLSPASRPLSAPKTRQTRRLQLRNAGFRGAAVPGRKVTPKSESSNWTAVSDTENVSPCSGARTGSISVGQRQSSGVLQEIGNSSTLSRPKKTRHRIMSANLFATDNNTDDTPYDNMPPSPPPTKAAIKPRTTTTRSRAKMPPRRSVSAEMGKYIEHLETELASAQSQLSSVTSPSVTRENSSKMRMLNVETRQLQQELEEWEAKYERRVQEAMDEHAEIESKLRAHIRSLEEEGENARLRMQELEMQLDSRNEDVNAAETANVNLEKRLEIMSELLAASPTKIDLHAATPGHRKRQQRPQSMFPRFPTASSLMGSPERVSSTQPPSPILTFANSSPEVLFSPTHEPLHRSPLPSDNEQTDVESVFSDAPGTADSVTSMETSDTQPTLNPWSLPPIQASRSRPVRRMRRFGAGSMGPKPLILPSTSHCEQFPPSSAPALERSETEPTFFSYPLARDTGDNDLAALGRRRASTTAGEIRLSSLEAPPPFLEVPGQSVEDESEIDLLTPHVGEFSDVVPEYSSIGSNVGRNLMEELILMRSNESSDRISEARGESLAALEGVLDGESYESRPSTASNEAAPAASQPENADRRIIPSTSTVTTTTSAVTATASIELPTHRRTHSRSASQHNAGSGSIFERLRNIFGDLWNSPLRLARHLVQSAQTRMRLPVPLLNVQWWLVGILLGPMAKRRLLSHAHDSSSSNGDGEDDDEALTSSSPLLSEQEDVDLAYGTLPTPASSPQRRKGGKRAAHKTRCQHTRRKHSPWVWLKFSLTLAFAVGAAFKDGPGSLLKSGGCGCWIRDLEAGRRGRVSA